MSNMLTIYLLGVGNKLEESSSGSYKNQGCVKQETWTSNFLNSEGQWILPIVVIITFP